MNDKIEHFSNPLDMGKLWNYTFISLSHQYQSLQRDNMQKLVLYMFNTFKEITHWIWSKNLSLFCTTFTRNKIYFKKEKQAKGRYIKFFLCFNHEKDTSNKKTY